MPDYIYDENSFQWLFAGEPEEDPDMLALLAPFGLAMPRSWRARTAASA